MDGLGLGKANIETRMLDDAITKRPKVLDSQKIAEETEAQRQAREVSRSLFRSPLLPLHNLLVAAMLSAADARLPLPGQGRQQARDDHSRPDHSGQVLLRHLLQGLCECRAMGGAPPFVRAQPR